MRFATQNQFNRRKIHKNLRTIGRSVFLLSEKEKEKMRDEMGRNLWNSDSRDDQNRCVWAQWSFAGGTGDVGANSGTEPEDAGKDEGPARGCEKIHNGVYGPPF